MLPSFSVSGSATGIIVSLLLSLNADAKVPDACGGPTLTGQKPLVIAHRGASGYRPEHTLASYQLAMEMGADFIEPDLVITSDGVLIARHEPNIIETSNVSERPEYAARRKMKVVDGTVQAGYFAEDFTLAEIKTLRAKQSRSYRDQSFNGSFEIPTLTEIIQLVKNFEMTSGRRVGIYIETKHPSYFREQGLPLEERLVQELKAQKFTDPGRIFIQSFEVKNLKDILAPLMRESGLRLPLVQLLGEPQEQPYDYKSAGRSETYSELMKPESLRGLIATYAAGIGPWKTSFVLRVPSEPSDLNGDGKKEATEKLGEVLPLVAAAHQAGLLVHPYTFRNEEQFLAVGYQSPLDEYRAFGNLGIDGFFTDFPDTARLALEQLPTRESCAYQELKELEGI